MNAAILIENVKNKYASCSSYSDRGHAESEDNRIDFETRYLKPLQFRFDCVRADTLETDVFYANSDGVYTYRSKKGIRPLDGLDRAIGIGSAISYGAINAVTELLFPGLMKPTTFGGQHEAMPDERIDEIECYLVKSINYMSELKIWISKEDLAVRKVRRDIEGEDLTRPKLKCEVLFTDVRFDGSLRNDLFRPNF